MKTPKQIIQETKRSKVIKFKLDHNLVNCHIFSLQESGFWVSDFFFIIRRWTI